MRVLIVEDERRLARNIAEILRETGGYAVDVSLDGEDGLHLARTNAYDLILLDLMLPKVDGWTILRRLRAEEVRTPVLVLTARDGTEEVVRGLDSGCDDYLTKPFDVDELVARCRALIRRAYDRADPVLRAGGLAVDTASHTVTLGGKSYVLPAMEYRLLEYFVLRAGQVVSKEDIIDHLYDFDSEPFSNVVEVYVSALRRRFGSRLIRTMRGQGYVLEGPEP